MAFKMKPGRGNYAKTGKGIPMSFKQDNEGSPSEFGTKLELANLAQDIQGLKKEKLSGYEPTVRYTKNWNGTKGARIETPAEKSIAADVLGSQMEKFKSGPSLINKDEKRLLNSPDVIKTMEVASGKYREPVWNKKRDNATGFGQYLITEYTDPRSGEKWLQGPSGHGFESETLVRTPKGRSSFERSVADRAMGKLDAYLGSFYNK